ncbi:hypothetical protein GCM10010978_31940 [Compostibacillus humi]|uniref:Uncharacterized protein n=1 Tax=Compostibacillus humi TaxID=1245525 RepID=A0A8J2XJA3_9BACI|nr:hypothetical protein GCM10010978_31940 [Compostibacillus humi]
MIQNGEFYWIHDHSIYINHAVEIDFTPLERTLGQVRNCV